MFARHLSILGSTMSTIPEFHEVMDLIVSGKLKPVIDSTFALQDAASAQERLCPAGERSGVFEKSENFGKITLDIP
jgi:D-arabinose 1-dehydrogenase-like Zn-dependent alcohol dehydrogenase